jgi:hypothetical protein
MGRSSHQREWDELADLDGLWAILSEPGKRHNRWQADEFFATGASEVENLGNVSFAAAGAQHLSCGEFDFVMCRLMLQHLSNHKEIAHAIDALAAGVRPGGGALVFDVVTHIPVRYRMQPKARFYRRLRRLGIDGGVLYRRLGLVPIRMRAIDDRAVRTILARRRIEVVGERRSAHESGVRSTMYLAAKR